jgi:hypothetical protein|tara:strand:- start:144 stop:332 length:189 start_codon:yes stop_codon:yes gene_type:complete
VKYKWNVDPTDPTTILRLISEFEGAWYLLNCLDQPEDLDTIDTLRKKYYKLYFRMLKEQSST